MNNMKKLALVTGFLISSANVNATIINFVDLTQSAGGLGESAWSTLSLSYTGFNVAITGSASDDDDSQQYAYLDWGNAGLGTCKDLYNDASTGSNTGSDSNICDPGGDDNVTTNEALHFVFSEDVLIKKIWFNNNHDGHLAAGDLIDIEGTLVSPTIDSYVGDPEFFGSFSVLAGDSFDISHVNEQFYISGMEVEVAIPEPGSLAIMSMGLIGLAGIRRRRKL